MGLSFSSLDIFRPASSDEKVEPASASVHLDGAKVIKDSYIPVDQDCPINSLPMSSLRQMYKSGFGPSSSHTMGPRKAAEQFLEHLSLTAETAKEQGIRFVCILFGSLAQTGAGHLTDKAVYSILTEELTEIVWKPEISKAYHPNAMTLSAVKQKKEILLEETYYSIGGGTVVLEKDGKVQESSAGEASPYEGFFSFKAIKAECEKKGLNLHDFVFEKEDRTLYDYLADIWTIMKRCVEVGLNKTNPVEASGSLNYPRKAYLHYKRALEAEELAKSLAKNARKSTNSGAVRSAGNITSRIKTNLIISYALSVSQENASATTVVVTAPTCGACGIVPGLFYYYWQHYKFTDEQMIDALAVAGIVGNIPKNYASVSGAEAGCQAEVGVATSMAAAGCCYLLSILDGSLDPSGHNADGKILSAVIDRIEYSAVVAMEHSLGLTCDPIKGLVVIPCIERNGVAALRADECAEIGAQAMQDGLISWDEVCYTMLVTGRDLGYEYRESAAGGLAFNFALDDIEDGAVVQTKAETQKERDVTIVRRKSHAVC